MVAAVAADDLEHLGVAALRLARDDADRLAAQHDRPAVPGLITGHHALSELPSISAMIEISPRGGR
jgi:hypothetical protein